MQSNFRILKDWKIMVDSIDQPGYYVGGKVEKK